MRRFTLIAVAATFAAAVAAPVDADDVFDARGLSRYRTTFNELPFEHIDPLTGNLLLTFTDLVLPGNAGFDLRLQRTYNSKIHRDYNLQATALREDSWAGIGWTLHLGRVFYGSGVDTANPVIEMPDGSQHPTYRHISPLAGCTPCFITKDYWVYDKNLGTLRMPNGLVYTFNHSGSGGPGATGARYATRIEDPYGNVVTASYRTATPTDALTQIVQTVGAQTRTVTFGVGGDGSLSSMTYNGRTWSYTQTSTTQFQQTLLTRADPPTGPSWIYGYNTSGTVPFELTQVTTPYGGTISYTYKDQNYNIGTTYTVRARVVGTRAVGGRDITNGTWTYTYATGTGNAQTVISGPCNAYTYTFSGVGTSATPGEAWRVGLMTRMQNSVDTVTTSWTASVPISNDDEIIGFNTDFSIIVPLVSQRTISRDGTNYTTTNTYSTSAATFNNYGRPSTISESGQASRTTSRTYTYAFGPYIVDKVASESVSVGGQAFSKSWGYQSDGFMTSETIYGVQTTFNDDAYGNVASMTNARGYTTYFDYSWGTVSRIQTPEHTTTRTINNDGTIASESRNGFSWSYGYDALGRLTSEHPPAGATTTVSYSASTISRSRLAWRITEDLDGFGRPSGTTDAEGVNTDIDYDACGRVTYRSLPFTTGNTGTTFTLDAIGRVERANHPGNDETFSYLSGNSVRRTDENARVSTYGYRSFGDPNERWLMSVSAGGVTTSYSRNAVGSLTQVSGTATGTRSFGYNSNNQLTSETHPESGQTTYGRDAVGNMTSRTDANNDLTSYTYDGNDRLRTINAPGTEYDATIAYDDADNRTNIANGVATIGFTFDGANRLTRRTQTVGGTSLVTDFGLDSDGNVTSIDYPSGGRVTYGVDNMGRVTSVTRGATSLASLISHHPSGNIASFRTGDGSTHTLSYDARHRPIGTQTSAGLNITYTRDDGGNVTAITDGRSGFSSSFGYDSLDRITSITGFGATSFTYSDSGNRLSKSNPGITYNYNAASRLSSTSGPPAETASFTYDNAGNQLTHGPSTFTYTPMNMMATATVGGTTSTYRYDADERRVIRNAGGRSYRTVHGRAGEVLGEFDVTGGTVRWVRDYVYAGARLIASASCDIVPSPATMSFTNAGGAQTLSVSAQGNCAWQPQSNQPWLTVSNTAEVLGAGSITVTAATNNTGTTRTATLRLSDATSVQVSQAAGSCTFSIAPTSFSASPSGQSGSLAVTTLTGCAWTATTSQPSWVSFPSGNTGSGSGALAFSVAANPTATARSADVTVGGLTLAISQAGAACTPTATPTSLSFSGNNGGSATVSVNAVGGCAWTGTSPAPWVTLQTSTSGPGASISGTGSTAVTVTAQPNLTFAARTATLTIANTSVVVSQTAYSCGFTLSPTNPTVPQAGGTADVTVTTGGICTWTATGLPPWATATIVSGVGTGTVNGTGTGTLRFTVGVGPDTGRSQTVTVAGQNIVLSQSGLPCNYTGSPATNGWLPPAGGSGVVDIVGSVTCPSGGSPVVSPGLVVNSLTPLPTGVQVSYTVPPNPTTLTRTGTILMNGQLVHTIYQLGTSQPMQAIESPVANALFQTGAVTVTGYAADLAAQVGTGVDLVHVFVDGVDQGPATYGLYHAGAAAAIAAGQLAPNFLNIGYSKALALAPGRHTITVWARSVVSGAPNSASVFPVDVNGQPSAALTAPANGAVVQAGQNVTLTAAASDPDGDAIARVEYYANGAFIGQATAPPFALTLGSIAGTYSLIARAVDTRGGVGDSPAATLFVNAPPAVSITTPPSGTTVLLGQTLTFGASVSDPEGNPVTVVYEANGGAISAAIGAPYTFSVPASAPGSFSVTARATDSRGGVTVSAPIVVTIQVPTSIAITSPPNGTTYTVGQAITIVAAASDPDGVNRVEFSYNGGIPAGTVTVPPYQLGLPGGAPAGTYTIVARMVDNLGNAVVSSPITIFVSGSFVRHERPDGDGPTPAAPGQGDGPASGSSPAESQGAWWLAVQRARADGLRAGRRVRARVRRWASRIRVARRCASAVLAALVVLLGLAAPAQAQVKIEYYHLDPIGSVRLVTDSAGAQVTRYDYHPFGEEVPPVTTGQPRRYAGKERDTETSYDYFGGRYYAGRLGRFTTVDPAYELEENLLDPQRWNRYAYVRNNPLRFSDPDGRIIETLWDAANVIMGARSLVANVATGNWGSAVVDAIGIVADAASTVVPGVPGGASTALKIARTSDALRDGAVTARVGLAATNAERKGLGFTKAGKREIDARNAQKYGGKNVCEGCGVDVVPGQRHQSGVAPPANERQRDHIVAKSQGGSGLPNNGQILCRSCNIQKSNK